MGFRISWLAVQSMPKQQLLDHFALHDTGEADEANEAPFSVAELPTGWTVLWSNDPAFANIERSQLLSQHAPVLSCWVNETVMVSSANYFENGVKRWFAGHDAQQGNYDLQLEGDLPGQFAAIRDDLAGQQESDGGDASEVDYYFDIPLELAQSICGFKHDRWKFEWGEPHFTVCAQADSEAHGEEHKRNGWLGRIFGR